MTFSTVFHERAAMLVIAGVICVMAQKLRQPLIISSILTGIVAGPALLGWAAAGSEFKLFSCLGIAALLFVVGLMLAVGLICSVLVNHHRRVWIHGLRSKRTEQVVSAFRC